LADQAQKPPDETSAETAPPDQPVGATASPDEPVQQPTADDIIRAFQRERPTAVPVLPSGPEDETHVRAELPTPTGDRGTRPLLPDGYMLVDRVGRIVKEGDDWVFVFESDTSTYEEPPMGLLRNQTLERMVRESRGGLDPVVFIVSGEVTEYQGQNFLLPRKVLRKRDLGNLKK
jgi:hypothetical protein